MGNYASCALAGASAGKAVKVVFPGGEVRTFRESMSAAELMLEMPSYFVVSARSLQIGGRFAALNADEDLEIGGVYVLFSMQKLNSVVSAADVGCLFLAAKKKSKVRVVPAMEEAAAPEETPAKLMLEELASPEFLHRRSMCRSKKPMLETIVEEPIRVR